MIFRFGKRGALGFPRAYLRERYLVACNRPTVPLYWFTAIRNWGDLVGPYLVKAITGAEPVPAYSVKKTHLVAVGSVLAQCSESSLVWGAGFISENDQLGCCPGLISAVRGWHTAAKLEKHGIESPGVVGDPALLMPMFYRPLSIGKSVRIGLIPHYAELPLLRGIQLPDEVKIIDIRQDVEEFVDELVSCEVILSSSLHGLIAADAYSIPSLWVEFSSNVIGQGFKFNDYYSSLDEPDTRSHLVSLDRIKDLVQLASHASFHNTYRHHEELLRAFPWGGR